MSKTNNNEDGIGFVGLLTIVFITLKLIGVIDWSWLWVLSPMWIVLAIAAFVVIIAVVVKRMM